MEDFTTLSEAIAVVRKEGYTEDFNLQPNCIECQALELRLHPEEFTVDQYFRFEGMSDPGDNSILYAITSNNGEKGLLVDAYGMYSENITPEMVKKLEISHGQYN